MTTLAERLQELRLQEYNVLHGPPNTGESLGKNQTLNNEFATTNNEYLGELTSPFKPLNKETKVLTSTPLTTDFVQKLKTEQTSTTSKFAHSVAPTFGTSGTPMESNPGVPSGLAAAIDQKNADNQKLIADAKAAEAAKATQGSLDDEQSTNAKTQKLAEANAAIATAQAATEQKQKDLSAVKNIEADEKFANYTGPEVPKTLSSDTSDIPDEYVLRGEAEDGGDLYLKSNGKSYDEVLKEYKAANGEEVSGAFFTKNAEDIIGNDRVSNEQREYLESGEALLPNGTYKPTEGRDFHQLLADEAEEKRLEHEAMMKAFRDNTTAGTSESMTPEEKARANNEYLGTSGQASVNAGQDQDFVNAKDKALKEREKALRTTNEIADEKLIEKARLEKLRQEEVARVEAKHNRNEGQDAFSGQGTDAVDPIKNQRGILDRINEERKGGESEATKLRQNQDFANSLDAEQKLMQEKALHERQINSETADNVSANFDKDRSHYRKMQAIKETAADVNASENAFQEDNGAVNVRSMMRGGANDPYHFTTLAYPPDAVNSQENGHFMLFYVNVQNKTKYSYDGMSNGKIIKVGDYIERPGYFTEGTGGPAGGGSRYITSVEASGTGANAGDVDYQKQMVRNGGKGNIIYNNQSILQKSRKLPKSGINSRYQTTTRITDSVALYLPSGIGNTTSASYGDFQTGVAGYLAMSGLDIVSELRNRDFQGAAEKIFGVGGTLITEAAKKLAVAGIETFTGSEGIQQSIDKAFGQTLNPYIEVAFNSTGMRTFDYTFKFAPKSRAETDEVKAIIQLFRFHMLPEMKSAAHRYLTLPSTFDIHYMWQNGRTTAGENSFYNKIATCVLTNVDINYTPNGQVQSFGDGAPTQIDMSLSFKETEMLTKQHVEEGF